MALLLTLALGRVTRGELAETNDFVGDGGRDVDRELFREDGLDVAGDVLLL